MIKRAAFSLIELVLAIVIIAISLMTIPLMLSQSSKSDSVSIMQESILAARTKMGNILSYQWDACATIEEGIGTETRIKVLDVIAGDNELNRSIAFSLDNRRIGHVFSTKRRRLHAEALNTPFGPINPSTVGNEVTKTNINGFHTETINMFATQNPSGLDYTRDFNITTTVAYISDNAIYANQIINFDFNVSSGADITDVNLSTNIKMIEINVQGVGMDPFILRAFSSNIGQADLLNQTFNLPP